MNMVSIWFLCPPRMARNYLLYIQMLHTCSRVIITEEWFLCPPRMARNYLLYIPMLHTCSRVIITEEYLLPNWSLANSNIYAMPGLLDWSPYLLYSACDILKLRKMRNSLKVNLPTLLTVALYAELLSSAICHFPTYAICGEVSSGNHSELYLCQCSQMTV